MTTLLGTRTLVTGAAGFIGANLMRELIRSGAEVHAPVRSTTNLWRIRDVSPDVHLHLADLTDLEALQHIVQKIKPEVVFHLAAAGGHPPGKVERLEHLRSSVIGTANLLEALQQVDLQLLVHFGSSLEYGQRDRPLVESDFLTPVTYRGAVKAAATILCQQFVRESSNPVVILRPFSVYGYWEQPSRLIPTALRAAFFDEELTLTTLGFRRDFVFVEDVVRACILVTQTNVAGGDVINIGSGQQWSNEEVILMIEELTGRKLRVSVGTYPPRPSDTGCWLADITKAKELIRWIPHHSLRTGLEKTISWFRSHQRFYIS